jgi:hypothetical protein
VKKGEVPEEQLFSMVGELENDDKDLDKIQVNISRHAIQSTTTTTRYLSNHHKLNVCLVSSGIGS